MSLQRYTFCHYLCNQTALTCWCDSDSSEQHRFQDIPLRRQPSHRLSSMSTHLATNIFNNCHAYADLVSRRNGFHPATHNATVNATHTLGLEAITHPVDLASYLVAVTSEINRLHSTPCDNSYVYNLSWTDPQIVHANIAH
jgi:hypothetical protein